MKLNNLPINNHNMWANWRHSVPVQCYYECAV